MTGYHMKRFFFIFSSPKVTPKEKNETLGFQWRPGLLDLGAMMALKSTQAMRVSIAIQKVCFYTSPGPSPAAWQGCGVRFSTLS